MSAPDFPRPLLLGHRGAGGEAPENTWPAFEAADAAGMHGFEIDVLLTRDRRAVVVHDLTLQRIAGGHGAIQSMAWSDLARLDVGSHFHPRFAGERIPLLEEVLDRYGKKMILDLEIKGLSPFSEGLEEMVVQMVREHGLLRRVIISSFNPLIIRRVRALQPEIATGYNYIHDGIANLRRAWFKPFMKPFSKHPQPGLVDKKYLQRHRKKGVWVIPWGVDDPEEIERLLDLGVDGIISDYPTRLRELWEARAAR
jgi:glycerophosphoryl diester phosphodiesterase